MSMIINIPFAPTTEAGQPLKRAIRRAAQENGVSEFTAGRIMSDFIAGIAEEMSVGNIVAIPGFGKFGTCLGGWNKDKVYPMFFPARGLHNEVRATCSQERATANATKLKKYREKQHPSSHKDREKRRTMTAMRSFKERLTAQERRLGLA